MRELHVVVNNKIATYLTRDGNLVCGNSDYVIVFSFDSEWDEYEYKTARFIVDNEYIDIEFSGNTVSVPTLRNTTLLRVGVYAGELDATTTAEIPCLHSILCGDAVASGSSTSTTNTNHFITSWLATAELAEDTEAVAEVASVEVDSEAGEAYNSEATETETETVSVDVNTEEENGEVSEETETETEAVSVDINTEAEAEETTE